MGDPLERLLRLVAEGGLTAEEAGPIIDALQDSARPTAGSAGSASSSAASNAVRIEVTEAGRQVVNLRVPLALGRMAIDHVPGLSADNVQRIRDALDKGVTGPLLVVSDEGAGDRVRIVLE